MLFLEIDNKHVTLSGDVSREVIAVLDDVSSYRLKGYYFSKAFKQKRWDGKEHLLKLSKRHGYRAPVGMVGEFVRTLQQNEIEFEIDDRRAEPEQIAIDWNEEITPRPYQAEAVRTLFDPARGVMRGNGILKMPIRSGKTLTTAHATHRAGVRTLFIVPSTLLLHQTHKAFKWALRREIGMIGDGVWNMEDVTIASVQTLTARRGKTAKDATPEYLELTEFFDLVIFDEMHHLTGEAWREVMLDMEARYKIGLSATAYLDSKKENEKGVIWLRACTGDIAVDLSTSDLIEQGYLMQPKIRLWKIDEPKLDSDEASVAWGADVAEAAIYSNPHRNDMIVTLAAEHVDAGRNCLIVTNRIEQTSLLVWALEGKGIPVAAVTGEITGDERRELIERFIEGDLKVLVGTVFGEGVDVPVIEAVINAEGGKDDKATMQRLRNLTISEGKTEAIVDDFMDMTCHFFAKHSRERLRMYRSERAFKVRYMG